MVILLATVFEGALRKWILPASLHGMAYLAKDVIACAFILRFGIQNRFYWLKRFRRQVLLIAALILPSFLIGAGLSYEPAIITYKNAVLWPLFALHLACWLDGRSIRRLTSLFCILCIGLAILGTIQFESPKNAAINEYAWNVMGARQEISVFGSSPQPRATGTFSYISGLSTFGAVSFAWIMWRFLTTRNNRHLCAAGAAGSLICIFTSGSRAAFVIAVLGLVTAIVVSSNIKHKGRAIGLILLLSIAFGTVVDKRIVDAYLGRATKAGDSSWTRVIGEGTYFIDLLVQDPIGVGLGQKTPVEVFRGSRRRRASVITFVEDSRSHLVTEGGLLALVGQALTLFLFLRIFFLSWRSKLEQSRIAGGVLAPPLIYLFSNSLWFDHVGAALWWFAIGAWLAVTIRRRGVAPEWIRVSCPRPQVPAFAGRPMAHRPA
jgi:hypothetical protein